MLDRLGQLLLKCKTVNVPMTGFVLYLLYSVIAGFSIGSAIASFAICGLYGFKMYMDSKKSVDANEEMLKKLAYLESTINVLKVGSGFKTQDTYDKSKRLF